MKIFETMLQRNATLDEIDKYCGLDSETAVLRAFSEDYKSQIGERSPPTPTPAPAQSTVDASKTKDGDAAEPSPSASPPKVPVAAPVGYSFANEDDWVEFASPGGGSADGNDEVIRTSHPRLMSTLSRLSSGLRELFVVLGVDPRELARA